MGKKQTKSLPWSSEMDRKLESLQRDPHAYFKQARQENATPLLKFIDSGKQMLGIRH